MDHAFGMHPRCEFTNLPENFESFSLARSAVSFDIIIQRQARDILHLKDGPFLAHDVCSAWNALVPKQGQNLSFRPGVRPRAPLRFMISRFVRNRHLES